MTAKADTGKGELLQLSSLSSVGDEIVAEGEIFKDSTGVDLLTPVTLRYNRSKETWTVTFSGVHPIRKESSDRTFSSQGSQYHFKKSRIICKVTDNEIAEQYRLPLLSPGLIRKYRPDLPVTAPYQSHKTSPMQLFFSPFQENDIIWFGIGFHKGTWGEGVGGLGIFEPQTGSFGVLRVGAWNRCSVRILDCDPQRMLIGTTSNESAEESFPCSGFFLWERISGHIYALPFPEERYPRALSRYEPFSILKTDDGYWFGASGGIIHTDLNFTTYTYWKPMSGFTPRLIHVETKGIRLLPVAAVPAGRDLIDSMKRTLHGESEQRAQEIADVPEATQELLLTEPGRHEPIKYIQVEAVSATPDGQGFFKSLLHCNEELYKGNPESSNLIEKLFVFYPLPSGQILCIDQEDRVVPFRPGTPIKVEEDFWHTVECHLEDYRIRQVKADTLNGRKEVPAFEFIRFRFITRILKFH